MKSKAATIVMIVLLAVMATLLALFMISALNGNLKLGFHFKTKFLEEVVVNEIYKEDFKEIVVEINSGDIEIKESDSEEVKLVIHGDKDRTTVENSSDRLYVKAEVKPCFGICFGENAVKVELLVPKDYANKIEVKNKYGDIEIGEFKDAEIDANLDCGDILVKSGKKVDIKNAYGDIEVFEGIKVTVDQKCGEVKIGKVGDVTVKNDFGDIKIDEVTEYLDLTDNCGDIKVEKLELKKDSKIKNDLGDIKIGTTNEIYIEASTDLGKVKINENYNKSDITLSIENDCGDVTVNN